MISLGNFEGQQEVEDQINYFMQNNRELLDTPIFAFVTFTTQEGKERFGKYNSKKLPSGALNHNYKPFVLLGNETEVRFCNEPSDIIWENLEHSNIGRKSRECLAGIGIFLFLICTTIVFSLLRRRAGQATDMYPSGTPCDSINKLFHDPNEELS